MSPFNVTIPVSGSSRFQEAQFQFMLSPEQATNIASNRDIRMGSKLDYLYQIQLRFCQVCNQIFFWQFKYFLSAAGHERGAGGRVPAEHLRAGEREDVQLAQPHPHQQAQRGAKAAPAPSAPHAAMQGRQKSYLKLI